MRELSDIANARRVLGVALFLAATVSRPVLAETPPSPSSHQPVVCPWPPQPYRFLRFLEDFRALRDPACRDDRGQH
jgi:hypothetical protein